MSFAKQSVKTLKETLKDKSAQCTVNKETKDILFIAKGIEHCCNDMLGRKDFFWIKNIILPNIDTYIKKAKYIGKK